MTRRDIQMTALACIIFTSFVGVLACAWSIDRINKRLDEMHDLQMLTLFKIVKLHSEPPSALPKIWYGMNDEDSSDSPSPHREER